MAQVIVVASATASASGSQTLTITKPTGTADGDLMIMNVIRSDTTVSTPSGWTLKDSDTTGGNGYTYLFYKVASSEGSSYAVLTLSGGNIAALGSIVTLRNQASSPFDQQSKTVDTTVDTTANGTAITPTTKPQSLLLSFTSAYTVVGVSHPASFSAQAIANNNPTWTELYDFATYAGGTLYISLNCVTGVYDYTTTTGAFTATMNENSTSTNYFVSIRPNITIDGAFTATGTLSGSESMAVSFPGAFEATSTLSATVATGVAKFTNLIKNATTWLNQNKS